jgi:hypothetical protein
MLEGMGPKAANVERSPDLLRSVFPQKGEFSRMKMKGSWLRLKREKGKNFGVG